MVVMPRRDNRDDHMRELLARVLVLLFAVVVVVILGALIFQRPLGLSTTQTKEIVGVAGVVAGLLVVVIRYYFWRSR
jgi:protein-S-isoprenylcysteine O-methyltransferase Ste14